MDIHHEVNQIIDNLEQNQQQLRFEFHPGGCTVILCNALGEHKYEMAPSQLIVLKQLFTYGGNNLYEMMQAGTVAYFTEEPQS